MMVDQFDVKLEDISPDTQLENLGFDSLSVVEFLFSLEDELKIKLSDQRLEIKTVGDLASFVDNTIAAQKGSSP